MVHIQPLWPNLYLRRPFGSEPGTASGTATRHHYSSLVFIHPSQMTPSVVRCPAHVCVLVGVSPPLDLKSKQPKEKKVWKDGSVS